MTDVASRLQDLADRCVPRAWRLACALMRNAADADDVLQQAFVVAARKPAAIPGDDPWPWFAAVIANTARNARRKRARHAAGEITVEPADHQAQDPLATAAQAQLVVELRRELAQLPEDEADAISLTQLSGLSLRQAALALHVPAATLNSRIERGLDRLRKRLKVEGAALSAALPLMSFDPPPLGFEHTAQAWLKNALAHASLAGAGVSAATGGIGMLKVFAAFVVLTLMGIAGWQITSRASSRPATSNNLVAGACAPVNNDGSRISNATHKAPHNGTKDATLIQPEPAKDAAKDALAKKTAAATKDTFSLSGRCVELTTNPWKLTPVPIARATVSVARVTQPVKEPSLRDPDAARIFLSGDEEEFSTLSAEDGTWTIKGIPRTINEKEVAHAKESPRLEQILVTMSESHHYCDHHIPGSTLLLAVGFTANDVTLVPADNSFNPTPPECVAADGSLLLAAQKAANLSGLVLDAVGQPVAGAQVELLGQEMTATDIAARSVVEKTEFHFPSEQMQLAVLLNRLHEATGLEFVLAKTAPVAGDAVFQIDVGRVKVRQALNILNGELGVDWRIEDGAVVLDSADSRRIRTTSSLTTSDKSGSYRFNGLCPDAYVWVSVIAEGQVPTGQTAALPGSGDHQLDFHLEAAGKIRVKFVPQPRATKRALRVYLASAEKPGRTAALVQMPDDGVVEFKNLQRDAKYCIRVVCDDPDINTTLISTDWLIAAVDPAQLQLIEPEPARLRVTLSGDCFAKGRTEMVAALCPADWFGMTVMDTMYELKSHNAPMASMKQESGSRVFEYYPGTAGKGVRVIVLTSRAVEDNAYLEFREGGGAPSLGDIPDIFISDQLELSEGCNFEITVSQRLTPAVIRGTVLNNRGGHVWLETVNQNDDNKSYSHETPDTDGKFAFGSYFWPGEYVVRWSKDGESRGEYKKTVTVKAGEELNVELDPPEEDK